MNVLDSILGSLLLRNNYVTIPSLGGFVANNIPAQIDRVKGYITPPKKALSFNQNLYKNDGLLIHAIAEEKGLTHQEAERLVAKEVRQIIEQLNKGQRVVFTNVGYLYLNSAGKMAFEQDRFFNLLMSSFGLGKVYFVQDEEERIISGNNRVEKTEKRGEEEVTPSNKNTAPPIVSIQQESKKENNDTEETTIKKETPPNIVPLRAVDSPTTQKEGKQNRSVLKKIIRYSAVASISAIIFYSFWIPLRTDVLQSGIIYREDFNPFTKVETPVYSIQKQRGDLAVTKTHYQSVLSPILNNLKASTKVFTYPINEDLYIPVERTIKTTATKRKTIKDSKEGSDIIVGCFQSSENAKDFIQQMKNIGYSTAYQVDIKDGLHRISVGRFKDKAERKTIRKSLSSKGYDSWVLKKQ